MPDEPPVPGYTINKQKEIHVTLSNGCQLSSGAQLISPPPPFKTQLLCLSNGYWMSVRRSLLYTFIVLVSAAQLFTLIKKEKLGIIQDVSLESPTYILLLRQPT